MMTQRTSYTLTSRLLYDGHNITWTKDLSLLNQHLDAFPADRSTNFDLHLVGLDPHLDISQLVMPEYGIQGHTYQKIAEFH